MVYFLGNNIDVYQHFKTLHLMKSFGVFSGLPSTTRLVTAFCRDDITEAYRVNCHIIAIFLDVYLFLYISS